jgi:hypothetical protein
MKSALFCKLCSVLVVLVDAVSVSMLVVDAESQSASSKVVETMESVDNENGKVCSTSEVLVEAKRGIAE